MSFHMPVVTNEEEIVKFYKDGVIEIHDDGTVWIRCWLRDRTKNRHELKRIDIPHSTGYMRIEFSFNGVFYKAYAHRIIWKCLVGDIPTGITINHKDMNKHNNTISNMEICTQKENSIHAMHNGEPCDYSAKISYEIACKIRKESESGIGGFELARKYNMAYTNMWKILTYKSYKVSPEEKIKKQRANGISNHQASVESKVNNYRLRATQIHKERFELGIPVKDLSEKYNCTTRTIYQATKDCIERGWLQDGIDDNNQE